MDSKFYIQWLYVFTMFSVNVSDIAFAIKNVDYWCIIHNISKHEASKLLENSVLEDCWYI